MNARSMTRTATMVAMALTMATMAPSADAAPRAGAGEKSRSSKEVAVRSLVAYPMAAWVTPMAVVLTSPEAWSQWNREQVDAGRAVAEEAMPQGVDWSKEVVVVLALGEVSEQHDVKCNGARKTLSAVTELSLQVETGRGGNCPALVLALERGASRNVKLMANHLLAGVPTEPGTYGMTSGGNLASSADAGGLTVVTSWGAMKAEYR